MHIVLIQFYRTPNPDYENIASALRERGHVVWLGSRDGDDNLAWHDGDQVFAVQAGPWSIPEDVVQPRLTSAVHTRLSFIGFILRLRGFLLRANPDIVQIFPGGFHAAWMLPLFMPKGMRFILDIRQINLGVHQDLIGRTKEWRLLKTWQFFARFLYDHACFNHAATARKVLGNDWPKWATVVPVGISPRFLTIEREESPAQDPDHPVRFVYLGPLTRFRELELLLLASQQVLSRTNRFCVVFVGPDVAEGFYQKKARELNLGDSVVMEPAVPYAQVPELLAGYDVGLAYVPDRLTWHLQPTIKVLEYRAAGMPILSTDVTGHRQVVEEGVNGLLVPNRVESLAAGMLRFIEDRGFLQQCTLNAAEMRQALTIEEVARMYEQDVYRPLLEASVLRLSAI